MGRERQELFRESNTKDKERIIVLAFEGNDTEEIYFSALKDCVYFNDELIYLHILKRPKTDTNSAPKHVFAKLKSEAKDKYNFGERDELWMIIDTDRWKNLQKIVDQCKTAGGMYVAISNPCFEIWLLMHISDFSRFSEEEKLAILKNKKQGNRRHVEKLLVGALGSFNKSNFETDLLLPNIHKAILQAKVLDSELEEIPGGIGSHVYKVVEKLIIPPSN